MPPGQIQWGNEGSGHGGPGSSHGCPGSTSAKKGRQAQTDARPRRRRVKGRRSKGERPPSPGSARAGVLARWGAWGFKASCRVEALTRTNPWAPPAPPHRRPWGRAHPATPHGVPPALGAQRRTEGRTRPAPGCAMLGATRARALALPRQASCRARPP